MMFAIFMVTLAVLLLMGYLITLSVIYCLRQHMSRNPLPVAPTFVRFTVIQVFVISQLIFTILLLFIIITILIGMMHLSTTIYLSFCVMVLFLSAVRLLIISRQSSQWLTP